MKKSIKKTPKTHLPKYSTGGNSNFNEFGQPIENTNSGTQNIYNKNRGSKINANQYAQAGSAIVGGGIQGYEAYSNPQANSLQKTRGLQSGVDSAEIGVAGAINPVLGMAVGAAKQIGSKAQTQLDRTDANGNIINKSGSKAGEVIGGFMDPANSLIGIYSDPNATGGEKVAGALTGGLSDMFTNRHKNQVESSAKSNMFSGGGEVPREFANSEVEKEENAIAPDGEFLQFSGKSHEMGGIPTQLDPGTLIFSDKLKLGKKTFAQLNKVNNTNKQDKVLDNPNADRISKKTAELLRMAKLKNSEMLFRQQESLKQEKIENYIKRMGGVQKYPYGGVEGDLNNNSIVQQTYQQDPRFYTYQGNPVMKPGLRALSKDSGVTTDIGMNNYNNLLNTRSQVQNSKVNVGKQLPKFEYINDPSKGDYNTQFENYKKVNVGYFRNGGRKGGKYKAPVAEYNPQDDIIVPGVPKSNTDFSNVLAPSPYDKQMDITDANTLNKSAWDADYLNNPNAERPVENPESNKFDWKGLATQGAYFAANNAGNIYDLARADKTETRKYNRATENLVTPNFRDADQKYLYMKNALKGASLGASGYLANLQQSHVNYVLNKAQIQQAADNINAGIKNQVSQYNTGIANEEILANAKIRANARNIKQSAIASTGSNTANQMNDVRNTEMDQKKLDGLIKMYPALSKDPEMLKYFMSFHK